jgi:hypothetical protein
VGVISSAVEWSGGRAEGQVSRVGELGTDGVFIGPEPLEGALGRERARLRSSASQAHYSRERREVLFG